MSFKKILLSHGSGGRLMHGLIRDLLLKKFDNHILKELADSAVINYKDKLAFTTDSFVVSPLFFPGADIGKLSVCGTVNDLVMLCAIPQYISLALIIEEGLERDEGAFLVRADGLKDGRKVRIDSYVNAPSLFEAFEKSGLTHETYLTGQSAALFTKMFVNDKLKRKGLFPPEVLDDEERAYYLSEAAKLDLTVDMYIESRIG